VYEGHVKAGLAGAAAVARAERVPDINRRTLQDNVYELLKLALISGEFLPGQTVTVREITEFIGTGTMPARDALRRLVAERALEILPNGTARVCLLDADQRRELLEIRVALEGMAVRRSVAQITPRDIDRLEYINRELRDALAASNSKDAAIKNREFHFELYRLSASSTLIFIIETLWMQSGPYLNRYLQSYLRNKSKRGRYDTLAFHDALIRALRTRDVDAAVEAICGDITDAAVFLEEIDEATPAPRGKSRQSI